MSEEKYTELAKKILSLIKQHQWFLEQGVNSDELDTTQTVAWMIRVYLEENEENKNE